MIGSFFVNVVTGVFSPKRLAMGSLVIVLAGCAHQSPEQAQIKLVKSNNKVAVALCKKITDVHAETNSWKFAVGISAGNQVIFDMKQKVKDAGGDTLLLVDRSRNIITGHTTGDGVAYSCKGAKS